MKIEIGKKYAFNAYYDSDPIEVSDDQILQFEDGELQDCKDGRFYGKTEFDKYLQVFLIQSLDEEGDPEISIPVGYIKI